MAMHGRAAAAPGTRACRILSQMSGSAPAAIAVAYLAVVKSSARRTLQRLHHALLLVGVLVMHDCSRFLRNTSRIVSKRSGKQEAIVRFVSNG
jgi:hypothetical protein